MTKGIEAKFSANDHVLVTRSGDMWVGRVLNETMEIVVNGTTLSFEISVIKTVVYQNEPYFLQDEMRFCSGMVLQGVVTTTPIRFEAAGQVIEFPCEAVVSIVLKCEADCRA